MKYIVRANNYNYNDENYYIESSGEIAGIFDTKQEAINTCNDMNIEAIDMFDNLADFVWNANNCDEKYLWVMQYYQNQFRIDLGSSPEDIRDIPIPKTATESQLLEIIKQLELRFYNVYEYDGTAKMVELQYNPEFWGKQEYDPFTGEYGRSFYFNEAEALDYLKEKIGQAFFESIPGLTGSLPKLSDAPDLLSALLEKSSRFTYDNASSTIKFKEYNYEAEPVELRALFDLLKIKPYMVATYSIEEAQKLTGKENEEFRASQTTYLQANPQQAPVKAWWQFWK